MLIGAKSPSSKRHSEGVRSVILDVSAQPFPEGREVSRNSLICSGRLQLDLNRLRTCLQPGCIRSTAPTQTRLRTSAYHAYHAYQRPQPRRYCAAYSPRHLALSSLDHRLDRKSVPLWDERHKCEDRLSLGDPSRPCQLAAARSRLPAPTASWRRSPCARRLGRAD